jgi:hypothetical protein
MALQKAQGAVMPGPFPGGGAGIHADAVTAINLLTYGAGLWGGAGQLTNTAQVRLDLQGYTGVGQMNLQLQVNGVGAPSTLATVLVANTVQAVLPPSPRSVPQQTEIVRVIKGALFDSLQNFEAANPRIWTITGNPSS